MTQPTDSSPAALAGPPPAADRVPEGRGDPSRDDPSRHDLLPGERPPSPTFVRLALLFALVLTLITVGLVGWRWLAVRFPNAAIVARGDATAEGVGIVVRSDDGREIARGQLTAENGYEFPVLVEQGMYTVQASKSATQPFMTRRYFVPNARGVYADIEMPAGSRLTTRPAIAPGTRPATDEAVPSSP